MRALSRFLNIWLRISVMSKRPFALPAAFFPPGSGKDGFRHPSCFRAPILRMDNCPSLLNHTHGPCSLLVDKDVLVGKKAVLVKMK